MTVKKSTPEQQLKAENGKKPAVNWALILSWGGTILLVAIMLAVLFQFNPLNALKSNEAVVSTPISDVKLPEIKSSGVDFALARYAEMDTAIPEGVRQYAIKYTVEEGDSIFAIAKKFSLQPESILYANFDLLNDDPTFLLPGWRLTIPPTDGVYYKWKEGDTLEKVAEKYYVDVADITSWPSNKLDVQNPDTTGLEYVMIPGGYREIQSWITPLEYTARSGATRVIAGEGGCQAPATGPVGTGGFITPTGGFEVSGFDFTSYHLGVDLTAYEGSPIYASDNGTVLYAGWNTSGYGNLIVIDHNNGYETLYAHLSQIYVYCGEGVAQGTVIGAAGSTGKSTGAHLHFEIRYYNSFINPWQVFGF